MKNLLLCRNIVAVTLIITIIGMIVTCTKERTEGRYTGANSIMSYASKEWVIDSFDEYETFDDLLFNGMTSFVLNNFVYDSKYNFRYPLQAFSFESFRNAKWHGVCFHFAQWAKSVVLEWSNNKGIAVQSYVFDVELKSGEKHSYNYFIYDGDTYYVDFTEALTRHNKNLPYSVSIKNVGKISMYEYAESFYKDKVYNVY